MKPSPALKKPLHVRSEFARKGVQIADWARVHGVNPQLVHNILSGKPGRSYRSGQSHRIAVLLGIKDGEIVDQPQAMNVVAAPIKSRKAA
jgi:gp16 family phage-associated protein